MVMSGNRTESQLSWITGQKLTRKNSQYNAKDKAAEKSEGRTKLFKE